MSTRPLISLVLMLPLAASAATPTRAATYQVEIRDFHFLPAQMTVPVGAQVTWTNTDEEPHIVVSTGNRFPSSPALDTGDHYQAAFARPGTYTYFCSIHPQMVGTIVVK
jgi:plastocyanin